MVKCIDCFEDDCQKNGLLNKKQRYVCIYCGRHFVKGSNRSYSIHEKREYANMIIDGKHTGKWISRRHKISRGTLISWVKLLKRGVI